MKCDVKIYNTISEKADYGARSAVTGGAQMDGFIKLISDLIVKSGIDNKFIFHKTALELPDYFRPTKEWDLLVVKDGQLLIALETKSQVGPSFGNNFNNRTEEAMGSALDLWTAYREGAFNKTIKPWLGYLFYLKIVPLHKKLLKLENHILKSFRNLLMLLILKDMNYFVENLCGKNIIIYLLS